MKEQIVKLMREGKSTNDILELMIKANEEADISDIAKAMEAATEVVSILKRLKDSEAAEAAEEKAGDVHDEKGELAGDERLTPGDPVKSEEVPDTKEIVIETKSIEASLDEVLEKMEVKSMFEESKTETIAVKSDNSWMEESAFLLKFNAPAEKGGVKHTTDNINKHADINQKNAKAWEATGKMDVKTIDAIVTGTDAAGGYLMAPEFDMLVDKLTYANFPLLDAITIRPGGEKTEINSLSTFDLSFRTDENTDFTATKPTAAQKEIKYRDLGAIVPISYNALNGAAYNLITEVTELAADARGRALLPLITEGQTSGDPFMGIWFTVGVSTVDCANKGGTGKIQAADLLSAYLKCAAQTRSQGVFVMDDKEILTLMDERDKNNRPLELVKMVNGKAIHMPSGKEIISMNNGHRTLNGVTDNSTGTEVGCFFGVLPRFRIYAAAGFQVNTDASIYFASNCLAVRFIQRIKMGIPTQSLTSFVDILGVKSAV